jgi:hypothetical protein
VGRRESAERVAPFGEGLIVEWLSQEWWRWIWMPALGVGLTTLAAIWKTRLDASSARDARLDARQSNWIETQAKEIDELRDEVRAVEGDRNHWKDRAFFWFDKAHHLRHALISARFSARLVLQEASKPVPETWDKLEDLPPIEGPRSAAE